MKYNEVMEMINHAARMKMCMNSFKGNIEQLSYADAAYKAKDEIDEVLDAVTKGDWQKAIIELGDVHNFVVAMGYKIVEEYRKRK